MSEFMAKLQLSENIFSCFEENQKSFLSRYIFFDLECFINISRFFIRDGIFYSKVSIKRELWKGFPNFFLKE